MQAAVEVTDLSVAYKGGFKALDGVDLELQAGKITGFIGPSGAGKTTLVRVLVGRQKITGGQATALGQPTGKRRPWSCRSKYHTSVLARARKAAMMGSIAMWFLVRRT